MRRFIVYFSKLFLVNWLVVTFGMVALVGLLDSLANASAIAESTDQGGALRYVTLRAPIIFDQIFLFALMLSLLLTYVSLIRRNELVAVQGMGLSVFAQIRAIMPVVLGVSILAGIFIDRTLPPSVQALNAWGIGEYEDGTVSEEDPLWVNDDGLFVRMKGRIGLETLTDLTFFHRDKAGYLQRVTWAKRAHYANKSWTLEGIETVTVDNADAPPPAISKWETSQTPQLIDKLAAEPRDLAVGDLASFASLRGSGSRPSAAYKVWRIKRLSLPLSGLAMLLIAVPIMQRLGRRDTGTIQLVIGVGISFLFMIFDGILTTTGATGSFAPIIAALATPLVLAGAGLYLALRQEVLT